MKKAIITFMFALAFAMQTKAQVFMLETESDPRKASGDVEVIVPLHDEEIDQTNYEYAPLTGGLLLLSVFSGLYLVLKKKPVKEG